MGILSPLRLSGDKINIKYNVSRSDAAFLQIQVLHIVQVLNLNLSKNTERASFYLHGIKT